MAFFDFLFKTYEDQNNRDYDHMRRADLIRILKERTAETEGLQKELEELTQQLKDRQIVKDDSMTIAEAVMRLNGIYDVAQKTASQYVTSVHEDTKVRLRVFAEEKEEQFRRLAVKEDEVNSLLFTKEAEATERLMSQEADTDMKLMQLEMETNMRMECKEAEVNSRLTQLEDEVNSRIKQKEDEVHAYCDEMLLKAKNESQQYWSDIQSQIRDFMSGQIGNHAEESEDPAEDQAATANAEEEQLAAPAAAEEETVTEDLSSQAYDLNSESATETNSKLNSLYESVDILDMMN